MQKLHFKSSLSNLKTYMLNVDFDQANPNLKSQKRKLNQIPKIEILNLYIFFLKILLKYVISIVHNVYTSTSSYHIGDRKRR